MPALGPSIALSAAVIIGAVVFGLACGTGLGLLLIKCYQYQRYRSFGAPAPLTRICLRSLAGAPAERMLPEPEVP